MNISVIGANSFIARNLIYLLSGEEREAVENIYLYDMHDEHKDQCGNYVKVNFLDKEEVRKNINYDVDIIYLFVGKTGSEQGFADYDTFIDVNERILLNVLDAMKETKSGAKIVFPSSRLVYKGKKGLLKEDDEKEAKTVYAVNKISCEHYLKMYNNVFDLKYVILRICVPYGTMIENASSYGTAEFMLSKAKDGKNIVLYGKGEVRRTLTSMHDLCETLYRAGINGNCVNDVYNVGGENYSLYEMATGIAKKYNVGVDFIEWPSVAKKIESGDTVFDGTKLKNIINYEMKDKFENWI